MAGHTKVLNPKVRRRMKRKVSIRLRVAGTADRPRLSVFRSAKHIYVQAVDDVTGRVLAAASDLEPGVKAGIDGKKKKERARMVGATIGAKLRDLKVEAVVFDRNGFMFHGRVKEVADGAREAGLKF
jgi:large subunit ribosomal protein L18